MTIASSLCIYFHIYVLDIKMSQLVLQYIEMCTSANNWYIQKAVETLNAAKKVNSNAFAIDF